LPTDAPRDRNGNPLALGTKVCYHERPCIVTKFDNNYPSLCEIDDPEAEQKFIGAKKHERWVRCDEIEVKEGAVPKKPKPARPDPQAARSDPRQATLPHVDQTLHDPREEYTALLERIALLAACGATHEERIDLLERHLHQIAFYAYHAGSSAPDMHAALQAILNNACTPLFDSPEYVVADGEGGQTIDLRPTADRHCESASCAWCHPEAK
jgi:hypothetical protein